MGIRRKTPVITLKKEEECRRRAVDMGMRVYFSNLSPRGVPSATEVENAVRKAEAAAAEILLPSLLDSALDEPLPTARRSVTLLRMEERLPPLVLPSPETKSEVPPVRVAAGAAFGTIVGMIAMPFVTWFMLENRPSGVFIGAPGGAMLGVILTLSLANSPALQLFLATILGLSTAAEVIRLLGGSPFRGGWTLLRGRRGTFKALLLSPLLAFLLIFLGRREVHFDRGRHEESARRAFEAWAEGAARVALFAASQSAPFRSGDDEAVSLLASIILSLENVPEEDLSAGVSELATAVRNFGFSGKALASVFIWNEESAEEYATFGAIDPGDPVRVERNPLFKDGVLLAKGLVRKVRRR